MVENKLKTKGTWGGARPGAGRKKGSPKVPGSGRRPSGRDMTYLMIRIDTYLEARIQSEADRQGISRGELVRRWAATLPESVVDKTQAMQEAYLRKKAIKKL